MFTDEANSPLPGRRRKKRDGARLHKPGHGGTTEIGSYAAVLRHIHSYLVPRTYVEIGVGGGRSLRHLDPQTRYIAIDPARRVATEVAPNVRLFELTSDEFFREHDLEELLGEPVDLAFIDGMHLFEFALRDFINLERACSRDAVILIHHCYPPDAVVAARERATRFWTGDVWKLILALRETRPELRIAVVDTPPSGLGIVTGLDPASTTLGELYDDLCKRLIPLGLDDLGDSREQQLGVIPGTWDAVKAVLPMPRHHDRSPPSDAPPSWRTGPRRASERTAEARIRVGPEPRSTEVVLYGYPKKWVERLEETAADLDLRFEEPPIYRFENLTFFRKLVGLYDQNGRIVAETRTRRGLQLARARGELPESVAIPRDLKRVAEPVLYGGQLQGHWGQFLTEGISRLWALQAPEVEPSMPVLFHSARHCSVPFVARFLRHAGIDVGASRWRDFRIRIFSRSRRRRLLEPRAATFEHVLVPHPSFSLRGQAFSCHATLPERVGRAIAGEGFALSEEPVYLSRRLLFGERRPANEEELEALLRTKAVRIVSPETLAFEDQVRLVNAHTTFIGRLGSAFHSLLYAPNGRSLRTAVFGDAGGSYTNFFMVDHLKGINASYIYDPPAADDGGGPVVDAPRVVDRLEQLRLI